jgi:hypothetical protein
MAVKSARDYEHEGSQDGGLARASSRAKASDRPCPIHPGMASRTDTSTGAPPRDNNPPDASSPLPTDPTKQHGSKSFPTPAVSWGMNNERQRGHHDPHMADQVMRQATPSGSTKLPATVKED